MSGEELLIADSSERDRDGMRRYFDEQGFVSTPVESAEEARARFSAKYFPVAVIDVDLDRPLGGIDLLTWVRSASPETATVIVAGRRTFEGAVAAFRAGAHDVILKEPAQVTQLLAAVRSAVTHQKKPDRDFFLELRGVLDETLRTMLELSRASRFDPRDSTPTIRPKILIVDGDAEAASALADLGSESWEIVIETSAGAALDRTSQERVDVLAVRSDLPDLPGMMVVKSVQATSPDSHALLFDTPGSEAPLTHVHHGTSTEARRGWQDEGDLVTELERLVELSQRDLRERRVVQAFRNQHQDLLRRFARVKARADELSNR